MLTVLRFDVLALAIRFAPRLPLLGLLPLPARVFQVDPAHVVGSAKGAHPEICPRPVFVHPRVLDARESPVTLHTPEGLPAPEPAHLMVGFQVRAHVVALPTLAVRLARPFAVRLFVLTPHDFVSAHGCVKAVAGLAP